MSDGQAAATKILEDLSSLEGVEGACLITRDGLPALSYWPKQNDMDTLAAMGAALMGAAETSLMQFGDRDVETVLIVSHDLRLAILGVDQELLLLAAMKRDLPIERFDEQLKGSLEQLSRALSA